MGDKMTKEDKELERIKGVLVRSIEQVDSIFVREEVNGKWEAVALGTLPVERWAHHVAGFITSGKSRD